MEEGCPSWQSRSSTKTHFVRGEHIWTVTNYEEAVRSSKPKEKICSDKFSIWRDTQTGREKLTFQLDAYLKSQDGNDASSYIGIFLRWCPPPDAGEEMAKEIITKFQFGILDKNGSHFMKTSQFRRIFTPTDVCWGLAKIFPHETIIRDKRGIWSDGSVKLLCSFEVLCIYPQDCSQAMLCMDVNMDANKETLQTGFTNLLNSGELSDVKLVCKGVALKCHKLVLSARSDVFKAMFSHKDAQEEQTNIVNIVDSTPDCVLEMVNFMYTDDCTHMKEHALGLLPLADKYNVSRLKLKCEQWLANNIRVLNVSQILSLADLHNSNELFRVAQNFAVLHMNTVKFTSEWKLLKEKHPDIIARLLEETLSIPTTLQSQVKNNRPGPKCKRQKLS